MSTRIRMPKGHHQLSLEGITYNPDEEGCFLVPDQYVTMLRGSHGAMLAPNLQDLEGEVEVAEGQVNALHQQLEAAENELQTKRKTLDAARKAQQARLNDAARAQLASVQTSAPAGAASGGRVRLATAGSASE